MSASAALYSSRSFFSVVVSLTEDSEEDAFSLAEDSVEVVFFDVDAFFDLVDVFYVAVEDFAPHIGVFLHHKVVGVACADNKVSNHGEVY